MKQYAYRLEKHVFNHDYLHKILLIEPTGDPYYKHRITDFYVKMQTYFSTNILENIYEVTFPNIL